MRLDGEFDLDDNRAREGCIGRKDCIWISVEEIKSVLDIDDRLGFDVFLKERLIVDSTKKKSEDVITILPRPPLKPSLQTKTLPSVLPRHYET